MTRSPRPSGYVNHVSFQDLQEILGPDFKEALRTGITTVFAELGLKIAEAIIDGEVLSLCGPKSSRKTENQAVRWGTQPGVMSIRGAKERITKPRVRTADGKNEIALETYSALHSGSVLTEDVLARIGSGVSTRQYVKTIDKQLRKHGVSKSAVSRRVIASTKTALDEFHKRSWRDIKFAAILIDGVHFGKTHAVAAVGIDKSGRKHVLGWQLGSTESQVVCRDMIRKLIDAGLNPDGHYLFVLDGSKALKQAVKLTFGDRSVIQRCQEHKIRDVEGYLPRRLKDRFRIKIQAAYNERSYRTAAQRLEKTRLELLSVCEGAANSLVEGMEETLTLHRLGIFGGVRDSLRTTNIIESAFARLRQRTSNVSNWSADDQVNRWLAFTLPKVESGFRRLPGFRQLAKLQRKVQEHQTALQTSNS